MPMTMEMTMTVTMMAQTRTIVIDTLFLDVVVEAGIVQLCTFLVSGAEA